MAGERPPLPTDNQPEPEGHDTLDQSRVFAIEKTSPPWPEMTFELSEQAIFGDQLPTNPRLRLVSVMRAISESIELFAPQRADEIGSRYALIKRADERRALLYKRHLINGQKLTAADYGDLAGICHKRWERAGGQNHPMVQCWQKISAFNKYRRTFNLATLTTAKRNVLTPHELEQLQTHLVLCYDGEAVKQLVMAKLPLRNQDRAGKTRNEEKAC